VHVQEGGLVDLAPAEHVWRAVAKLLEAVAHLEDPRVRGRRRSHRRRGLPAVTAAGAERERQSGGAAKHRAA
jgi:hypothetical protein